MFKILFIDEKNNDKGKKRSLIPDPPKPPVPPKPPQGVPPIPPLHWRHLSEASSISKPFNIPGIRRL